MNTPGGNLWEEALPIKVCKDRRKRRAGPLGRSNNYAINWQKVLWLLIFLIFLRFMEEILLDLVLVQFQPLCASQ